MEDIEKYATGIYFLGNGKDRVCMMVVKNEDGFADVSFHVVVKEYSNFLLNSDKQRQVVKDFDELYWMPQLSARFNRFDQTPLSYEEVLDKVTAKLKRVAKKHGLEFINMAEALKGFV